MIIGMRELALLVGTLTYEPSVTVEPLELACLARNAFHEARDQGIEGMTAVAYVTIRRLETGRWDTLCEVVEAPSQFSWFSDGKPDQPLDLDAYRDALHAAIQALTGRAVDLSRRATHYYAHGITTPKWAAKLTPTAVVGGHTFLTTCESVSAAPECSPIPPRKPAWLK